jgi:hypothetical protein
MLHKRIRQRLSAVTSTLVAAVRRCHLHGAGRANIRRTRAPIHVNHAICIYPDVARYIGHGSTTDASSFVCRRSSVAADN